MMALHEKQVPIFEIEDLCVSVEGKEIIKGLNLTIYQGKIHAMMGRNGSGKTTLACVLMGHPKYQITRGSIRFKGEEISGLKPHERARKRIFLAFQYPSAVPGVSVGNFLRASLRAVRGGDVPVKEFRVLLEERLKFLGMSKEVLGRYVNDGFSGGEKKRLEILQMSLLEPEFSVLDETDSGLDIDALNVVAEGINRLRTPHSAMLLITHYQRLLNYVKPDFVHVLMEGGIVKSGGPELALELEQKGYEWLTETYKEPI